MSFIDLYVEPRPIVFAGVNSGLSESKLVVVGVPFDSTASYRSGQREGPEAVRKASANIEGNSYFVDTYIDDLKIHDLGDVSVVYGNTLETVYRVEKVVRELIAQGKKPIVIGGEHTITLGVVKGLTRDSGTCMLVLDAHYDLRPDYLGERYSHACVMRRILESTNIDKIVYVGVRAFEEVERSFAAKDSRIEYIQPRKLEIAGVRSASAQVLKILEECQETYISVDMDVYDPAYAPGVGNPEPLGLTPREVFAMLKNIVPNIEVAGVDLVEVTPPYDPGGITSLLAAKTLQEIILMMTR